MPSLDHPDRGPRTSVLPAYSKAGIEAAVGTRVTAYLIVVETDTGHQVLMAPLDQAPNVTADLAADANYHLGYPCEH